jgi:LacI family transcriptional regulator
MARVGAKMLLERIHAPGQPARRVDFPCDLIVRGSTRGNGSALKTP